MNTTMGNLENWVRQLNGELNVQAVAKTKKVKTNITKDYHGFLNKNNNFCCQLTLVNSNNKSLKRLKANFRLIFDHDTHKLIDVKLFNKES
jgi:hypothetical protein